MAFAVLPVLGTLWVADWLALPETLRAFDVEHSHHHDNDGAHDDRQGASAAAAAASVDGLHALLAPSYSIDGALAAFRFCDPMATGKPAPQRQAGSSSAGTGGGGGGVSHDKGRRSLRACYGLSLVFLAIYVAAAAAACPGKVPLAMLNVLALLVADAVHFAVTAGRGSVRLHSHICFLGLLLIDIVKHV